MSDRSARLQASPQRILILDGGMGTMIQSYRLEEHDYRGTRFADWPSDVKVTTTFWCSPPRRDRLD